MNGESVQAPRSSRLTDRKPSQAIAPARQLLLLHKVHYEDLFECTQPATAFGAALRQAELGLLQLSLARCDSLIAVIPLAIRNRQ